MKSRFNNYVVATKEALHSWWQKDPFKESAVIAYYSIFSLPGLLSVIVFLSGYFFDKEVVNTEITNEISSVMGTETAQQVQSIILKAMQSKKTLWENLIGIAIILFGATGVFIQFQKALNKIWKVKEEESKSGIIGLFRSRLLSFGLIIAIAFILITSLLISTLLAALGKWLTLYFPDSFFILLLCLNFLISLGVFTLVFGFMFKYFPDTDIRWSDVWLGSFITAVLFEIGKSLLGFYFGTFKPDSGYGSGGSVVLIMLWVSYSSMLVLLGAEFTYSYTQLKRNRVKHIETKK
ncbi:YihY/virulence factor BrkB family protein [Flavobacterium sp.]|mgnify:CR=1 FL=1|uniref:YihY/virulence factor BrkB family protein n=1 Tax=Flavobacterium sp. TaxID=239 RepID=UPI002FDE3860